MVVTVRVTDGEEKQNIRVNKWERKTRKMSLILIEFND